ncbi:MAG: hypothetical protein IKY29_00575 [Clostridia bacterium]|nr:hypothetical protein [Clostridia bacterium]
MLRKLIKYDVKSVARVFWFVAISVLGLSVFGASVLRGTIALMDEYSLSLFSLLGLLISIGCIFLIYSSMWVTFFLTYWRYYKNLFSDEGYLTFTLPVSRKQLLLSKTINALIWSAAQALLLTVSVLIYLLIVPEGKDGHFFSPFLFDLIGETFVSLWKNVGAWLFAYIPQIFAILFVATLFQIGMIQFSITVGAIIAKRVRLLVAVGVYYALSGALTTCLTILIRFAIPTISEGIKELMLYASPNSEHLVVLLFLTLFTVVVAALSAILHFSTLDVLERKLNLP